MRFGECGICDQGSNSGSVCRCDEVKSSSEPACYAPNVYVVSAGHVLLAAFSNEDAAHEYAARWDQHDDCEYFVTALKIDGA